MFRRFLAVAVVLAIANPLLAQLNPSDAKPMPPTGEDMRILTDRVAQLELKFKRYQETNDELLQTTFRAIQRDMSDVKDAMTALRRDLDAPRTIAARQPEPTPIRRYNDWREMQRDVDELRETVRMLRNDVDDLRRGAVNRYPENTTQKPVEGAMRPSSVVLVNEHPTMMMDTVVNGVTYTVMPNGSRTVTVAPGRVRFQVMQTDGYVRERDLQPGEMKIVTMR